MTPSTFGALMTSFEHGITPSPAITQPTVADDKPTLTGSILGSMIPGNPFGGSVLPKILGGSASTGGTVSRLIAIIVGLLLIAGALFLFGVDELVENPRATIEAALA